jgi:hypothetical protein
MSIGNRLAAFAEAEPKRAADIRMGILWLRA